MVLLVDKKTTMRATWITYKRSRSGDETHQNNYLLQEGIDDGMDNKGTINVYGNHTKNLDYVKHTTPTEYKTILHKDLKGPGRKGTWNYHSVIGTLYYRNLS